MNHQPVATAPSYYHQHLYAPQLAHGHYHDPAYTSVGYRPLQLPTQQVQQQQYAEQQHQQQQLSLAAAGYHHHPAYQAQAQQHSQGQVLPVRTRQQARQQQQVMAYQEQTPEELAELQKLSNEYQPETIGPLVGQREPCTKIATEYATADPVYQAKTAALPQKYSHYRTVRGDGRCGWRAIAFGWIETLIHHGDTNRFYEEEARLRSMYNILEAAGWNALLYEDFADEAFDLLREVANGMHNDTAGDVLVAAFNDEMRQNYIITYVRMLAAAWMKTRPGEYAPFVLDKTVDQYCDDSILPMDSEIENVSLSALKDVLLSPAGMALEVLYLDRTEGGEVNMHRFDPVNPRDGVAIGTIRLLYRPGHYDILYKAEDLPYVVEPITYLNFGSQPHQEHVFAINPGMDYMMNMPGASLINPHQHWLSYSSYDSGVSDFFTAPNPQQHCIQTTPNPAPVPTPAPVVASQQQIQPINIYMPQAEPQLMPPPLELSQELAIRSLPQPPTITSGYQQQLTGPFRPSAWQFEEGLAQAASQRPFQTSIFKNSPWNTAHFRNPDFQPEEWRPDDEYVVITKPLRHKTSG
ncbi:hypothetical protein LTR78_009421 [Recurvomyces mirabilis]|uniref:ubiquitinyl hydrolase 1 n=1 Tax=Recurvomyces mirabilis TaxID=574656 RepID=A0AAE0TPM4_9PEZI|nr:hypothetical protein LTR78_009421 [Recurvomyces mirabilis]KAK5154292.1 hypothetical protein LTS14_006977 [Recurvomyces mirabilis]